MFLAYFSLQSSLSGTMFKKWISLQQISDGIFSYIIKMSDMFNHGSHGSYGEGSRWVVKRIEHQMNALNEQGRNRLKVIGLWSQPSDIGVTISIFFMLEIQRNLHFPSSLNTFLHNHHFQLLSDLYIYNNIWIVHISFLYCHIVDFEFTGWV